MFAAAMLILQPEGNDADPAPTEPQTFISIDEPSPVKPSLDGPRHAMRAEEVQLASAVTPVANLLASSVAAPATSLTLDRVTADRFVWPIDGQTARIKLSTRESILLQGSVGPATNNLELLVDPKDGTVPQAIPVSVNNGDWTYTINNLTAPAFVSVRLVGQPTSRSILLVPPDNVLPTPEITGTINNRLGANVSQEGEARVFDRFLILQGQRLSGDIELFFPVFDQDSEYVGDARVMSPIVPAQDGVWHASLELPSSFRDAGMSGQVLVRAESRSGTTHVYANPKAQAFKIIRSSDSPLPKPTITTLTPVVEGGQALTLKNGLYISHHPELEVQGTQPRDSANTIENADIGMLFFLDETPLEPTEFRFQDGQSWVARLTLPSNGNLALRAASSLGNRLIGPKSEAKPIAIDTQAPEVVRIDFKGPEGLVTIEFSEPVEIDASATLSDVFSLTNRNVSPTLTSDSRNSDKDDRLNLKFDQVTPEVYTFSIDKPDALRDLAGNVLIAEEPREFFYAVGEDRDVATRGVVGATGKNVEFPEYTTRAPVKSGFNPGDHVETRVANLYYYRDAHRVAQILNREVQSYNRAAVSMQEQAADKARQKANQATDDRQAKERRAVEASQLSRQAEQELQQAEQRAQTAASEVVRAGAELTRLEQRLSSLPADAPDRPGVEAEVNRLRSVVASLDNLVTNARGEAQQLLTKVQQLRVQESDLRERWNTSIAVEDRAREEQFRREVAAAHADPDTYVAGKPDSADPVRQVSISVIGEGVIQLRGPIKGINIIRTMINQIDSPVGQVRIGVHTAQINGEDGQRMEKVAGKIQRYVDHSRFLTMQSTEMLRTAILQVAAAKAMEAQTQPGLTQAERDQKYLYAFYGEDFIRELEAIDSEFLKTGNKLLSLHSMNSTSLASALFNMALTKNSVRLQIIDTVELMMQTNLPFAEQAYFEAGVTCDGKEKLFGKYCTREDFCLLGQNARFQSLRGFFQAEVPLDDTMTPVQREFVRLAQIFKSRLIVELELRQRIMERAVIEEKLGDYAKELEDAKLAELSAQNKLQEAERSFVTAQSKVRKATQGIKARAKSISLASDEASRQLNEGIKILTLHRQQIYEEVELSNEELAALIARVQGPLDSAEKVKQIDTAWKRFQANSAEIRAKLTSPTTHADWNTATRVMEARNESLENLVQLIRAVPELRKYLGDVESKQREKIQSYTLKLKSNNVEFEIELNEKPGGGWSARFSKGFNEAVAQLNDKYRSAGRLIEQIKPFELFPADEQEFEKAIAELEQIQAKLNPIDHDELLDSLVKLGVVYEKLNDLIVHIAKMVRQVMEGIDHLLIELNNPEVKVPEAYQDWIAIRDEIIPFLGADLRAEYSPLLEQASDGFEQLLQANLDYEVAERTAQAERRPLDHKKFLDMLVDQMEEKYIELLEGTRSYTANVDGYIKRLMTALDDDFNTQFYHPAFRQVRGASRDWAVQLGQIETTTILANNRAFAKVAPQATMEFDLPKRDILITEALQGAKAVMDDVGALANDPSFVSLAQIKSGQPTATPGFGTTAGLATVRDVLPGLNAETSEQVLTQHGPGGTQFGSAMESLIPDPAIYKFETGTGFEIRPVLDPDGQSVVFDFHYMYTTNVREPVRADEKHLGRVKRHFIDTDVQLGNFELREVSRYTVALKAARTSQGVPLLQDIPVVGVLWRPLPSAESSLQQNIILAQATIFPTLFDLMGLRWAPVVADLDPLRLSNEEFIVRNRKRYIDNRVFDHSSSKVDDFLRIPEGERRMDLYRSQETVPARHPNGYQGPGVNLEDSQLQEGYDPGRQPESGYIRSESSEGRLYRPRPALPRAEPDPSLDFNAPRRPDPSEPERLPARSSSSIRPSRQREERIDAATGSERPVRPVSYAERALAPTPPAPFQAANPRGDQAAVIRLPQVE